MYFSNRLLTNTNPILLGIARVKESRLTTQEVIGLSNMDVLAGFAQAHGLEFRLVGDLPALSGVLGSGAPQSNSPCPICPVQRQRVSVGTLKKQVLDNDLEFHIREQESR